MSIVTDFIKLDKEYGALLETVKDARDARTPLPTLVSGLCDGASDSAFVSLIKDLKKKIAGLENGKIECENPEA